MKPVININDVALEPRPEAYAATGAAAGRFDARMGQVGRRIGSQQLGCNITAVPPGMRAFPFHNHHVNEELFIVLAGNGEVRIGTETFPVRTGDVIACPAGGRETAHQIINSGNEELRYLAISTERGAEICEYPDSNKYTITATGPGGAPRIRTVGRCDDSIDYWEGE